LDRTIRKFFDDVRFGIDITELRVLVRETVLNIARCAPEHAAHIEEKVDDYIKDVFDGATGGSCLDPDHLKNQALAYTQVHFKDLYGGSDS
jgi:hypothetical protein